MYFNSLTFADQKHWTVTIATAWMKKTSHRAVAQIWTLSRKCSVGRDDCGQGNAQAALKWKGPSTDLVLSNRQLLIDIHSKS